MPNSFFTQLKSHGRNKNIIISFYDDLPESMKRNSLLWKNWHFGSYFRVELNQDKVQQ